MDDTEDDLEEAIEDLEDEDPTDDATDEFADDPCDDAIEDTELEEATEEMTDDATEEATLAFTLDATLELAPADDCANAGATMDAASASDNPAEVRAEILIGHGEKRIEKPHVCTRGMKETTTLNNRYQDTIDVFFLYFNTTIDRPDTIVIKWL